MEQHHTPATTTRRQGRAARLLGSVGAALTLTALLGLAGPGRAQTDTPATVTVNAGSRLAAMPRLGFGINTAVWDGKLSDPAVPALLRAEGITMMRYPGGSTSDEYHWQTDTMSGGRPSNPANNFDSFMGVARKTGADPIIIVNYGSNAAGTGGGDPAEAAAWVDYANNVKHYGIRYWEIGNELYGNGQYGKAWEKDLHASHTPDTYGANVALFSDAMKAKDPTIKVGVVLTALGNWPYHPVPDWNTNVLAACAGKIDFVILHWYPQDPGGENDAALLASTGQVAGMVNNARALVNRYCGANAPHIPILVTEMNSVSSIPGKQTINTVNGLFAADGVLSWLENGVINVDWWALHNGAAPGNTSTSLYGTGGYGDYGFLSNGGQGEPPAETPYPAYYGLQLARSVAATGDALVAAKSSRGLLHVHAARRADGHITVMLVNTSPTEGYAATVHVSGAATSGQGRRADYGPGSTAIVSSPFPVTGSAFPVRIAPYTVSVLTLPAQPLRRSRRAKAH